MIFISIVSPITFFGSTGAGAGTTFDGGGGNTFAGVTGAGPGGGGPIGDGCECGGCG